MLNNKFVYLLSHLVQEGLKFNQPLDKLLSNFFKSNKQLGSNERHIIAETIYALVRNYYKLTTLIASDDSLNLIGLIWLKLLKLNLNLIKNINCIDFNCLNQLSFNDDPLSQLELPEWIRQQLQPYYLASNLQHLALSLQQPAPLDLRVNLIKTEVNTVFNLLTKEQFNPQLTEFSPFAIRLTNKAFLAKHALFTQGLIEVQDEASQIAGMLLNPKRGEMIADFCAGSGGKTLLFGMLMRNLGRIYAFDINPKRLNNLSPRLARSGLSNVYPQLIAHEQDNKIKRLYNKIDRVFVDAPCSGLGTLRRNPELKFRLNESKLAMLNQQQLAILTAASKLVKLNGQLVYATCSILACENQDIVTKFLAHNPNFTLVPAITVLTNPKLSTQKGYLTLLPHIHHTDGFFAALLKRIN